MYETEVFEFPPASMDRFPLPAAERSMIELPQEAIVSLPSGLDRMAPGVVLAAVLSRVDPADLSGHDRVLALKAHHRLVAHFEGKALRDAASISDVLFEECDEDLEIAYRATEMELRAALRLTRRAAETRIDLADDITNRLPVVGEAMFRGDLDLARARVLANGTCHLSETQARRVVDKIIEDAPRLTTGQLGARVRKLCMAIEPEGAKQCYEHAVENRRLVRESTVDGTANLMILNAPPNRAGEAFNRINHIAKSLHLPGETRTLNQIRTDVALDLLCGRSDYKTTGRGTVNIHVDLTTLTELAEAPGELAGFGPVVADIARQVTEQQQNSEWRFRVIDPKTGLPIHTGTTKRRHNTAQGRHVELRDLTCIAPGCRMPATECDIDHTNPWSETRRTNVDSLAPLCRHDHVGKHLCGWTYQPIPGGDYLWTSRLGHTYTTSGRPPPE